MWCKLLVLVCVAVVTRAADKKTDDRPKRNLQFNLSHHYPILEKRISTVSQIPYQSPFFPRSPQFYKGRPQSVPPPPYAVQMEPLVHYSQRDPLYSTNTLSLNADGHDDLLSDNNHLTENLYGSHKQIIERPVYIKEPEPIIEIIIKESNVTLPPVKQPPPPPKKKEEVQVFYVKYKKNPHGDGKDVIYDRPVPAISPPIPEEESSPPYEEPVTPVTLPPTPATTLRTIIHPESEVYHGPSGIKVTFGKESFDHSKRQSKPLDLKAAPQGRHLTALPSEFPRYPSFPPTGYRQPQPYRPFTAYRQNFRQTPTQTYSTLPKEFRQPVPYKPFDSLRHEAQIQFRPETHIQSTHKPGVRYQQFQKPQYAQSQFPQEHKPQFGQGQSPQEHKPQFVQGSTPPEHKPPFVQGPSQQDHKPQLALGQYSQEQKHQFGQSQFPHEQKQQIVPGQFPQEQKLQFSQGPFSHEPKHQFAQSQFPQEQKQQFGQVQFTTEQKPHFAQRPFSQEQKPLIQFPREKPQLQQNTASQEFQKIPHQLGQEQQKHQYQHSQFAQEQHKPAFQFNQVKPNVEQQKPQYQQPHFTQDQHKPVFPQNQFTTVEQPPQYQQHQFPQESFLPPGGQLIQSVPKYEQHISVSEPARNQPSPPPQHYKTPVEIPRYNLKVTPTPQTQVYQPQPRPQHSADYNEKLQQQLREANAFQDSIRQSQLYTTPRSTTIFSSTTPTTTSTTATSTTTKDPKILNEQLPDEVPDDLRQQLLSSGILNNAQISILDYDKVGDIPLSALPPEQLSNFFGAGGAQQIAAAGSEPVAAALTLDGTPVETPLEAEESEIQEVVAKPEVEMKVVRFNADDNQNIQEQYVKEDATQVEPVDLNISSYNRYLPLKVNGTQFPIPDVPELKSRKITSVVILAPIAVDFTSTRQARSIKDEDIELIEGDALRQLLKNPSKENFLNFFGKERHTAKDKQAVILLVTKSEDEGKDKEIFMYDVGSATVSKLSGDLSSAFVDAAEANSSPEAAASEVSETRVMYEFPIIDPSKDLETAPSENLETFVDRPVEIQTS